MNSTDLVFSLENAGDGYAALKLKDGGNQALAFEFACGGRTSGQPGRVLLDKNNLTLIKKALQDMLRELERL